MLNKKQAFVSKPLEKLTSPHEVLTNLFVTIKIKKNSITERNLTKSIQKMCTN